MPALHILGTKTNLTTNVMGVPAPLQLPLLQQSLLLEVSRRVHADVSRSPHAVDVARSKGDFQRRRFHAPGSRTDNLGS